MDELVRKADLENLRQDLRREWREDLRGTETRLGAKIDDVGQRLGAKINEVDQRLGTKIEGVDQRVTGTEDRLKRHTDMRFEALRDEIRKVGDGVLAINERLDRHIQQKDEHHARLERAMLAGDAALDTRVTALERRAQS
jgi:hypothetical protein